MSSRPSKRFRSGIRLVRATDELVELGGRVSREGPLLVAVALAALALVPVLSPGPLTVLRLVGALSLVALALGIGWRAFGARRRIAWRPRQRELVAADGTRHSLPEESRIVLTTSGAPRDPEPRLAYRAELEIDGGRRELLLEDRDPALVLGDLAALLRHVNVPVVRGWGIPAGAEPWRQRSAFPVSARAPTDFSFSLSPLPSQRRAAIAVLGGAIFTTVAMGVMFGARLRRGDEVGALSWALAIVVIVLLYAIGIFVATDRIQLTSNDGELVIERVSLGRTRTKTALPLSEIAQVHAIGPGGETRHLLFETRTGCIAIACGDDRATELVKALSPRRRA